MASVGERKRKDGSTAYWVRWRNADDGKQTSYTTDDKQAAELVQRILNANGQSLTALENILEEITPTGPTVAEVIEEHIDLLMRATPQTVHNYRKMLDLHLSDLGRLNVEELGYRDVALWVQDMQRKPRSAKTIRNVHGLLSSAMNTAVKLRYRADNPCDGIALPSTESKGDKMQALTSDEYKLVRECITPEHRILADFLVYTGARFGEATAVGVSDIDLGSAPALVRINKAWKRSGSSGHYIAEPKTATSKRTVSIPSRLADELREHVEGVGRSELVFQSPKGGRLPHVLFWRDAWTPAIRDAQRLGLEKDPTPHDLRHTSASWLLAAGLPLFEVSRRLGHASVAMTDKVYGHFMPGSQGNAADIMEGLGG
ncbi:tyrosine-type recombinase/integrase [Arthrobacter sp. VKM Ac-2550]|uniref:tyrosine-type recombinase/integrase n=1 Tax=Crystallibacter permensis TaxID=1938888 RepID=UPI0022266A10|nr:site-specific integrase [Arthrobacter sp. VKM Ac-2550]MCW2132870.1 Site-specific recombinase XerD [Arthrobacter sp. VKM Ac-2550]